MPHLSRRQLALSLGASAILAPFAHLLERPARAASGKKAKRLLIFCTMGAHPDKWAPTNVKAENSFELSAMLQPLAAVKQHIVLIDGMVSANPGDNHASPDGLTGLGFAFLGKPAMISVDQFVGDKLKASGSAAPLATLLLGTRTTEGGGKNQFYRGNNLPTISSPLSAFTAAFGAALPTGTTMATLVKRRKSILDLVKGEVTTLRQRVGISEGAKLDAHLDSLRQLETRLSQMPATPAAAVCSKPPMPSDDTGNVLKADLLHLDVIVNAFACDVTRVAAIEFGSDASLPVDMPELGLQGDQHGGFIHGGGDFGNWTKLEQWFSQRFVDMINRLKAIPEADGSGSLFDNTLLAWCRDMGDALNHNQNSMKFVLAGGAGGYLKTDPNGRYLRHGADNPGSRHERVLLNLIEAMGINDFSGFGDAALSPADKTPLPGVS